MPRMTVISHSQVGFEIEAKRLKLPYTFKSNCPLCRKEAVYDLSQSGDYISYPSLGPVQTFTFSCSCGAEWTAKYALRLIVITFDVEPEGMDDFDLPIPPL